MKTFVLPSVLLFACLALFQNCAQDDLPSAVTDTSSSTGGEAVASVQALSLAPASVGRASSVQLAASGGTPPYTYMIVNGASSVDANTGLLTSTADAGYVTARVTDAKSNTSDAQITVGVPPPAGATAGAQTISASDRTMFTVPAYRTLTVELLGAGGGGGGANADKAGGSAGGAGGVTTMLSLTANGGSGGRPSNNYAGVNYAPSSKAADGTGVGGDTNETGKGNAGAAGGVYGATYGERGGAGGRVLKVYYYGEGVAPAQGMSVPVDVGAGGSGGANGGLYGNPPGTGGTVKLTWTN